MFIEGDELVLIFVIFLILLYLGWRSTEVSDNPLVPVVAAPNGHLLYSLVDVITNSATAGTGLRRRRPVPQRETNRVNNNSGNNSVEHVEYNDQGNILMSHVLSWATNDTVSLGTNTEDTEETRLRRHTEYLIEEIQNEGPQAIIREMDRDLPDDSVDGGDSSTATEGAAEEVQNCTNENSENVTKQQTEDVGGNGNSLPVVEPPAVDEDPWKIKIKYLNDDVKIVEANPSQSLGEFKRRNFIEELAANKLVRLVFNGKVLQPESMSLRNCGLFENCVVHCLVHNYEDNRGAGSRLGGGGGGVANASRDAVDARSSAPATIAQSNNTNTNNPMQLDGIAGNDEGAERLLANNLAGGHRLRNCVNWFFVILGRVYNWRFFTEFILFTFTTITIYMRFRFAEYFTSTATVGLIFLSFVVLGISVTLNMMESQIGS